MIIEGKYTKAKVFTKNIDEKAIEQLKTIVNHPSFTNSISIMPDVHAGASNAVIGLQCL
jgi:RNA-splicing ligase RtcB